MLNSSAIIFLNFFIVVFDIFLFPPKKIDFWYAFTHNTLVEGMCEK